MPHDAQATQKGKRPERPPSEKVYPQVVPPGFPFDPSWEYSTILSQIPTTCKWKSRARGKNPSLAGSPTRRSGREYRSQ
jgi:hypothetical protein